MMAAEVSVLPVPVAISSRKRLFPIIDMALDGMNGLLLIRTEEAQPMNLQVAAPLVLVFPTCLAQVVRALGAHHVVVIHHLGAEALRHRDDLLIPHDRRRRREGRDHFGIAFLQVPEVMQIAVGEDDEAAVLRLGVFPCLLLADERVLVLGLGFEDDEGERLFVEQQEVDEALVGFLEVRPERVEILRLQGDLGLKLDIRRTIRIGKEAPTRRFEQLVDLDARGGFFGIHADTSVYLVP
jgi:hypothetical protein